MYANLRWVVALTLLMAPWLAAARAAGWPAQVPLRPEWTATLADTDLGAEEKERLRWIACLARVDILPLPLRRPPGWQGPQARAMSFRNGTTEVSLTWQGPGEPAEAPRFDVHMADDPEALPDWTVQDEPWPGEPGLVLGFPPRLDADFPASVVVRLNFAPGGAGHRPTFVGFRMPVDDPTTRPLLESLRMVRL